MTASKSYQDRDSAIYALATPAAESALAVVRTSGDGVIDRVAECFSRPDELRTTAGNTAVVGVFCNPGDRAHIDQVVCLVYRAPRSYTGEDSVEISCHGSLPVIRSILSALDSAGLREAEPGEFTLRAFLAGKMGLTQAEAVAEIIHARTDTARGLALGRLEGQLEQEIERIKQVLVKVLAAVQIQLDYPEEDTGAIAYDIEALERATGELRSLVATYRSGRLYQAGVQVALAGATNAGKSSLFNRLLREERSIVSETHGTTRDFIEATVEIADIPVRLYDTAGLRQIDESVEQEGIRRTREVIDRAAALVYLVDATRGIDDTDRETIDSFSDSRACILLWNKIDMTAGAEARSVPDGFIPVSAATGEGMDRFREELERVLTAGGMQLTGGETVIDNARQANLVSRAIDSAQRTAESMREEVPADLVAVDLQDAVDALGEITGEVTSEDILDTMFGDFCVGK
ncbi:MAG: tRNA uridine-5-carboxymethylaminomethyl(34) synthesis GTPase MnmE [Spirochaetales bacterium]